MIAAPNVLMLRCNHCSATAPRSNPNSNSKPEMPRCAGCKIVRVCCQEHQSANWAQHKADCTKIRKKKEKMEKEEEKLRTGDDDPFGNAVGHFWEVATTRPYMRARMQMVLRMLRVITRDSVETSLSHLLDMLRLSRSDNIGVRDIVGSLYLRLQQDQEAYDFTKWWADERCRGPNYNWGDASLPYLNLKGEDVMEDPGYAIPKYGNPQAVPALLVKLRMLLDLRDLRAARELTALVDVDYGLSTGPEDPSSSSKQVKSRGGPCLNYDVLTEIYSNVTTRSSIWRARPKLLSPEGLSERIALLEGHVTRLFDFMYGINRFFWRRLIEHGKWTQAIPEYYSLDDEPDEPEDGMTIFVKNNAMSWVETEGAIEWVKLTLRERW